MRKASVTSKQASFDLMVDDLEALHDQLQQTGYQIQDIHQGSQHKTFKALEPSGNQIIFSDSHVVGLV